VFGDPSFGGEKAPERFAITEKWAIVTSQGVTSSHRRMTPSHHLPSGCGCIATAAGTTLIASSSTRPIPGSMRSKSGSLDPDRGGDHADECDAIERHTALQ
jgi:hypothetical protein